MGLLWLTIVTLPFTTCLLMQEKRLVMLIRVMILQQCLLRVLYLQLCRINVVCTSEFCKGGYECRP